jgi:hypothetical protein
MKTVVAIYSGIMREIARRRKVLTTADTAINALTTTFNSDLFADMIRAGRISTDVKDRLDGLQAEFKRVQDELLRQYEGF